LLGDFSAKVSREDKFNVSLHEISNDNLTVKSTIALQLWKLVQYSVLNCHNVGKHKVLPLIVMIQCDFIGNATDIPPIVNFLPHTT
jgi:hypothetical protein